MGRKKKIDGEVNIDCDGFIYCHQRKCPKLECSRNWKLAPFNEVLLVRMFQPDDKEEWNCKWEVTD